MLYFYEEDGLKFVQLPKFNIGGTVIIAENLQALCSEPCEGCSFHKRECECSLSIPFSKYFETIKKSQEIVISWQEFFEKELQKLPENKRNN
ncbi:hypothetical protein KAJ41_00365 [Candidatus Parcubacteria bacterium]|nr:hypothetical protein [Candidatus Parcubacteria bacterium]